MKLESKVAIVTGGSNGIGEAVANKLKELGAKVIVFDIKEPRGMFEYHKVDITKDNKIKEAITPIEKVDILVNNAGIYF